MYSSEHKFEVHPGEDVCSNGKNRMVTMTVEFILNLRYSQCTVINDATFIDMNNTFINIFIHPFMSATVHTSSLVAMF